MENSSAETTPRVSSKVSKINRAPRRALREKRKAIGVCTHLQSMEVSIVDNFNQLVYYARK